MQAYNRLTKQADYSALANSSFISPALQKKTKGFVDFDLQLFRPAGQGVGAHEKRFEPYNLFPNSLSTTKKVQSVDFNKIMNRDNRMYKHVKLSDSLFTPDRHLNLTHKKQQGIL